MSPAHENMTVPDQPQISVPATRKEALDPQWLSQALASVSDGSAVESAELVEDICTVATKLRFAVTFAGSDERHSFCIKGLLDVDEGAARGGPTCVLEADFYSKVAPTVSIRVPDCVSVVVDREAQQGVIIIGEGDRGWRKAF